MTHPVRTRRLSAGAGAGVAVALALTGCASAAEQHPTPGASMSQPHQNPASTHQSTTGEAVPHPYVGLWVTADRHVRHELLPQGRYVEARGEREAAYTGRYWVSGTHIEYRDDTGFTADGDFVDLGTLHHAGMVLTRVGAGR